MARWLLPLALTPPSIKVRRGNEPQLTKETSSPSPKSIPECLLPNETTSPSSHTPRGLRPRTRSNTPTTPPSTRLPHSTSLSRLAGSSSRKSTMASEISSESSSNPTSTVAPPTKKVPLSVNSFGKTVTRPRPRGCLRSYSRALGMKENFTRTSLTGGTDLPDSSSM